MNKIYKVVWSKAKHCYVVTSELAKRNTKGCGARSLRMAAVSMGVAAALLGGFGTSAEAGQHFIISGYRYTSSFLSWQPDTKSVTVTASTNDSFNRSVTTESDGSLQRYVIGNVAYEKNGIPRTNVLVRDYRSAYQIPSFMEDGESVRENAGKVATEYQEKIDGYAAKGADVSGYTVTLDMSDRGNVTSAYGGYSQNGNASNNTINVKSGTMDYLTGGYSNVKEANGNRVNVSGGTVKQSLMGGRSWGAGNTNSNTVTISNGSVRIVHGGWADGNDANANGNRVTISNGTSECVIGGFAANETNQNIVTISGGTIASAYEDAAVIGARNYGFHDATNDDTSVANKNEVTISGTAKVTGDVFGAVDYGYGAVATSENKVTIDGSASVTGAVMGGASYSRDQTNNKVYVNSGTVTGNVYGGRLNNTRDTTATGNADSNRAEVRGGTVTGNVYGGSVEGNAQGSAVNNTVRINSGTVTGHVDGGYSANGAAENNKVYMDGGTVEGYVEGGLSDNGSAGAKGNEVTISGGTVKNVVLGAYVRTNSTGNAENNKVTVSNTASLSDDVQGGQVKGSGKAISNSVTLTGGTASKGVLGGATFGNVGNAGSVENNVVTMSGGNAGWVYGGYSDGYSNNGGEVTGNTTTITGGSVGSYAFGGASYSDSAATGDVNGNQITISSETGATTIGGRVFGGESFSGTGISGNANSNVMTISGGTINGNVGGGASVTTSGTAGNANSNEVTVNGGTVNGSVFGGYGYSGATGNIVTVSGGTLSNGDSVGDLMGGYTKTGAASGNTVTITGGTVTRDIYGGYTQNGTSNDNTVNLAGTANLSGSAVYGCYRDDSTGNELHVGGVKDGADSADTIFTSGTNNKVERVANFNTVALHSVNWSTSVAALEATMMFNIGTLDITNMKFYEGGSEKTVFANGEEMALLKNTNSDLSTVTLTYNGGTGVAITQEGVVISGSTEEQTEETGVGGVKLTTQGGNETVKLSADSKAINYTKATGSVTGITFGEATFAKNGVARDLNGLTFAITNTVVADGLTFAETNEAIAVNDGMTLAANATGVATEVINNTGKKTVAINYTDAQGIAYGATASGAVTSDGTAVSYTVDTVTLNSVDLANWNGTASNLTEGDTSTWTAADGSVAVATGSFTAPEVAVGGSQPILTAGGAFFADANITGANKYDADAPFSEAQNSVTVAGTQAKGVKASADGTQLVYAAETKNANSVTFGNVNWQKDATLFDGSSNDYDYSGVTTFGTDSFDVAYTDADVRTVAADDSMTLMQANATLEAAANKVKTSSYSNVEVAPGLGVFMNGNITGRMSRSGNNVVFTATENRATQLTFRDVEWKDTGALMTRPANITFAGANVDTSAINFTNINELEANSEMTLVSNFGNTVGTITGTKYRVGLLEGEGAASLSDNNDLIFTATTAAKDMTPAEATHETVMAMDAGTAVLSSGREYVDNAIEGLGLVTNVAPDGTATFASMGGGANRYKTGSHVDTHSWNAIVAVGSKREHKKGDLEWGVFAEYGRGNYTLHDDIGGRGDGDTHYAGGGLLAKWTNKHNVYTEASIRLGRMSDSAKNMLWDGANWHGYDVHANYFGGHIGVGKIFKVKGNHDLDVYGKFFYTRRNGVNFDAGVNHYDLDSVASSLLRVGARYGSNDKKWNWYGGLAYEYEFDGESTGTVSTGGISAAIRSASIKGSSVRAELGVRMEASKTNPWKADIGIYAYGGRHRGFGGTLTLMYMFR